MGRNPSIDHDDLAIYLEGRGEPVPTQFIAKDFDCSKDTACKHCKLARTEDGYPIYPTPRGQYYLARIANADDLSLMLQTQSWSAKCAASAKRINGQVQGKISVVPPKRLEKMQDELSQSESS